MTQRDKWAKRPSVLRYRAFKDECRLQGVKLPDGGAHVTFYIKMPESWSRKKRDEMNWEPHQQTPDVDNLLKALLDATHTQDCTVYDIRATKLWHTRGSFTITKMESAS